ncbi:LPXTG cell wall anchor domain-containing protein, partial [[Clostridium] hylemonae]|uniref:LPXTG cell wall anchor domain-containing protein n=2 Tax=[Clostridium] hylemonae TaxID=89153 RepID=UPI001D094747
ILQTGDNAPYKAGTNTDLSPTPGTAAVQWALESGTGGIRYKNNTNTGFLPLGATVEPVDGVPHTINMTINDSTIPQTGDGADPLPWLLAMPAALAGGVSLLFYRKRRYTKQHG